MNNLLDNDFGNDFRIVVMMLLAVWCYQFIAKRVAKSKEAQPPTEERANDRRKQQRERMQQAHSRKTSRHAETFRSRVQRRGEKMGLAGEELEGAVTAAVRMFPQSAPIKPKDRTCVRIRLATPPPAQNAASFFGGDPELPEEIEWPKDKQGVPMGFLAQIACAELPDALWSGAGPREGYLRFFLPLKWGGWGSGPYVIHTLKRGLRREGPSLSTSEWFSAAPGIHCKPRCFEVPRWPIMLEPIRGDIDPINPFRLRDDPHNPPPDRLNDFGIDDPAQRPWSLSILGNVVRVTIERLRKAESNPYRLTPKTEEQAQLLAVQSEGFKSAIARLDALYRSIETRQLTLEQAIAEFDTVTVPRLRWTAQKAEAPSRLVLNGVHHLARPDDHALASKYELKGALFEVERFDYLQLREDLPTAVTERLDREFAFIAAHETAGMGHVPTSYYHGHDMQGDEPVTLLELPSSNLMGWMFGDLDRLSFTIGWNDLVAGDFSKVFVDVSNG